MWRNTNGPARHSSAASPARPSGGQGSWLPNTHTKRAACANAASRAASAGSSRADPPQSWKLSPSATTMRGRQRRSSSPSRSSVARVSQGGTRRPDVAQAVPFSRCKSATASTPAAGHTSAPAGRAAAARPRHAAVPASRAPPLWARAAGSGAIASAISVSASASSASSLASLRTLSRPMSSITGIASGETWSSTRWRMRPRARASIAASRPRSVSPPAASARVARSSTWSG